MHPTNAIRDRLARHRRRNSAGVQLALASAVVVGVLAVGVVTFLLWPRWPGSAVPPGAPELPIVIEGVTFKVPPAAIRVPVQRRPGVQERLDLAFLWPSLTPPDPAAKPLSPQPGAALDRLFVTIAASEGALAPLDRLKTIYPRYAEADPVPGPDGLHTTRFRDGSPYQGEDLFFEADAPERFLARCSRDGLNAMPGTCLLERRIGAAVVTVRFPRDWLAVWRELDAGIDRLIAELKQGGE